ncbi:MAG TPA: tryptophan--tRNA ligase [Dehalococcoidia bacterium]|nr:tryptophan--tRNA ligase [Dehalococcoidia bacterium]
MSEIRVFSGIQPSGEMHLGNYLGAVRQWVENQGKGKQNFYCIVDLHAHTILRNSQELRDNTRSLAAMLFACGLDPNISTIFIQSQVRAHAEACWLLNCVTPLGWLERMTQYKDKKDKLNSISAALLDYPVLQAGDIILYDANEVPIGEDQKQHVELARDIAQRFNNLFGETFVLPEPVVPDIGARVMNLSNPLSKMSKSFEENDGGVVGLLDSDAEIIKTIKRAVTDSSNEIKFSEDKDKAGVNNLLGIYKVITGKSVENVEKDFEGTKSYGVLKEKVGEIVVDTISPIRAKYQEFISDPSELDRLLVIGAENARSISEPKVMEMKNKMGFI